LKSSRTLEESLNEPFFLLLLRKNGTFSVQRNINTKFIELQSVRKLKEKVARASSSIDPFLLFLSLSASKFKGFWI